MSSVRSKRFWGTAHVARMLQVTPTTVANWIDSGHLKGHRTPTGRRRVDSADLREFLKTLDMAIPPELSAEATGPEVVVVVDDDAAYLTALVRHVERSDLDLEVVQAGNGVDGLIAIGRHQPALIVLDYRLPDLNAVQIIERLLERQAELEAEVLVVTGGVTGEEEAALKRLGVQWILNKADGIGAVIEVMRAMLGHAGRRIQSA